MTITEYASLRDDEHGELVRGSFVREPFAGYAHSRLVLTIGEVLRAHVRETRPDLRCVANMGVILTQEPPTVRGPDLAVVRLDALPTPDHSGFVRGAPELAIEIVSPSNGAEELQEKVRDYFAAGAKAVWVVFPRTCTIAVHEDASMARFLSVADELTGGRALPGFRVPVSRLFAD